MSDLDVLRDLQAEYAAARANGELADFTGWLMCELEQTRAQIGHALPVMAAFVANAETMLHRRAAGEWLAKVERTPKI